VDNVQRKQIGHIPKQVAAKLASYMDDRSLLVEARITGQRGEFDCPLEVGVFGMSHPYHKEHLRVRMRNDRLPLDDLTRREREDKRLERDKKKREQDEKQREKQREKQLKAAELKKVVKQGAAVNPTSSQHRAASTHGGVPFDSSSNQQWAAGMDEGEISERNATKLTLEDLAAGSEHYDPRKVREVVESYGAGEKVLSKMPMADQPQRLETELLPYQRQALAWLLDRENPRLPPKGSKDSVQMWKRQSSNTDIFTNIATNFSDKNPKLASGGILADDMGLGKTIEIISLIVADPLLQSSPNDGSNTTLIVAPLSVMSNWSGQMERHVEKRNPLRVLTYHGPNRPIMAAKDFTEYDIVVTTYGMLTSEYFAQKTGKPASLPSKHGLYSTSWRRIVLDEGHNIRNPQTKSALAASAISAQSHWALTGTPIINSLKDLYSLIKFIGLTGGLQELEVYNSVLMRPMKRGDKTATLLLQALMATLCLRRRKEMKFVDLKLPELKEFVHKVKFNAIEQERYDALQDEAKGYLHSFDNSSGSKAQDNYRNLLEVLLRLRQVCNHWQMCGERITRLMGILKEEKTVKLTGENRKALQSLLQLSIESREDCPICLDDLFGHEGVITHCGHVFGKACISRVIDTQHKCPMCRADLSDEGVLVEPDRDLGVAGSQDMPIHEDGSEASSKVEALLNILGAAHRKEGTKIVVFSQWCRFLDLVQPFLDRAGYKYARLDGTMTPIARDASLTALESDPETTILLASLGVASVGLNLTAANQVILCDTWWAPAIEDQAVDRVHRLGQKRDCTVWRLVVEDSVEERTLDIQAEKRKLMSQAFQEKCGKRGKGSQARAGDIHRLLGH
jgi:SWI/SNF-related matrix-associated actin-dependent regulator of chromatin subfamily A3